MNEKEKKSKREREGERERENENTVKPVLSRHLKRTSSIKRTVAEVPKFVSLIYLK